MEATELDSEPIIDFSPPKTWLDKLTGSAWSVMEAWGWYGVAAILVGAYAFRLMEAKYRAATAPPLVHSDLRHAAAAAPASSRRKEEDGDGSASADARAAALKRIRERQQRELDEAAAARADARRRATASHDCNSDATVKEKTTRKPFTSRRVAPAASGGYNPLDGGGGSGGFKSSRPTRSRG